MNNYFISVNGQQIGPMPENELPSHGITPNTLVWREGMAEWKPAAQVPELSWLFSSSSNFPPSMTADCRPMPPTNLVLAIVTTVLCCLPLGIVGIIKASNVSSAYNAGDYATAKKNSEDARKFCIWGIVIGGIFSIIYTICVVAASFSQADLY